MKDCSCAQPRPFPSPAKTHLCVQCGYRINPEWTTTDQTVAEFFDRLAESQFPGRDEKGEIITPPWWDAFREHVQRRELEGREKFGHSFLGRDNPAEATEEACDGALYMLLDGLRAKREGWDTKCDPAEQSEKPPYDLDVALTAAYHFAQGHRYSRMLTAKRRGNTGPGMDEA